MNALSEKFEFDLAILGGGASGLLVIDHLLDDPFFRDWRILLVEKDNKTEDDRTWCYWEVNNGRYDHLLTHQWDKAVFRNNDKERAFDLAPYTYKMLRSSAFYKQVYEKIEKSEQVRLVRDRVEEVHDLQQGVRIETPAGFFTASKCLNSIRDLGFIRRLKGYPLVQQHFVGWFIKTAKPVFDQHAPTLMDFSVAQKGNTRFMYVLPVQPDQALVEYTLFSPDLLETEEYEAAIKEFLEEKGVEAYEILEKEQGNIPMTAYPFHKDNSRDMMYIGTAGGWTKASTGYTFHNAMVRTQALLDFMKSDADFRRFRSFSRFDLYDRIFLNVLYSRNDRGAELFTRMFVNRNPVTILKFLDNATGLPEELSIMLSMPQWLFMKNLITPSL